LKPTQKVPTKPNRPEVVDVDKDRVEIKWTNSEDPENIVESYDVQMRIKGGEWEQVCLFTCI